MATVKVFSAEGVKELKCFDTLDDVPYDEDEEDMIVDDGELIVGAPIRDEASLELTRKNFEDQFGPF